jgi:hypothetical protein
MTTREENSKKIQKLENLLQESNITVTRNKPLDRTSFAIYKENKKIFTIKLVFRSLGLDKMGLDSLQWGIKIESDNLTGTFYDGPDSAEYTELRKLYNSVGDTWLSPRTTKPKQSNLFKVKLFSNIFTHQK